MCDSNYCRCDPNDSPWENEPENRPYPDLGKEIRIMKARAHKRKVALSQLTSNIPKGKFRVITRHRQDFDIVADSPNLKVAKNYIPKKAYSAVYYIFNSKGEKVSEKIFECLGGAIS